MSAGMTIAVSRFDGEMAEWMVIVALQELCLSSLKECPSLP